MFNELMVVFYDEQGNNPLGSDGVYYSHGLKTIAGLRKRMNKPDFASIQNYDTMVIVPHSTWSKTSASELYNGNYPKFKCKEFQIR